jgi:general secretion pathway protein D
VTEPIIAQKTSEQVIRLREGEASVLSGMVNKTDEVAWTGVPGLSAIPGLKYLFGSKDHTIQEDEIVFVVVPHVVRSQNLEPVNLRTIDTGAGQTIELRHLPSEEPGRNPGSGSNPGSNPGSNLTPARPAAQARPAVGVISSQSATEAAPAAMAELLRAADANGKNAASAQSAAAPPATSPAAALPSPQAIPPAKPAAALPAPAPQPARLSFAFAPPPAPVAAGADFKLPVVLNGGVDIAMVPLQIEYDAAKLSLLNVDKGDFLGRDGQPVSLVHRDDGPGSIKISASRPPGAAGMSGTGVVCVLTFQAKAAGASVITISRPGAVSSAQAQLPAQGAQVSIQVK